MERDVKGDTGTIVAVHGHAQSEFGPSFYGSGLRGPAICVICLERVADPAVAVPCNHNQFHFICLATWLYEQVRCPLCKTSVTAVDYVEVVAHKALVTTLSVSQLPRPRQQEQPRNSQLSRNPRGARRRHARSQPEPDTALSRQIRFRREVYAKGTVSKYIGSNSFNGFRPVNSTSFARDPAMTAKAKKWIRRELAVFDFLDPGSAQFGRTHRRASNAEFLLEYIIAVLRCMDIKGSAGQAADLVSEYLGRENARIFLHELESWLRSPFERLQEWDEFVQYD